MSSKPVENSSATECSNVPNPVIESNSQSRHHDVIKASQELEVEQFISNPATPNSKSVVYGNSVAGNETVREATMTLYSSVDATDLIL